MIKLIKKIKADYLPILKCIMVKDGKAYVTDLDVTLVFKTEQPEGLYKKSYWEQGLYVIEKDMTVTDFPKLPVKPEKTPSPISNEMITHLKNTTKFISKDTLRPVINGVLLSDDTICATDAHMLYYANSELEIGNDVIASKMAITLLTMMGEDVNITNDAEVIKFSNNKCDIYSRTIDGKYPNFKGVIPTHANNILTLDRKNLLDKIVKITKATKTKDLRFTYKDGSLHIKNIGTDYDELEMNELCRVTDVDCDTEFGLNSKMIQTCLRTIKTNHVKIRFDASSRAILINYNILIMPVMLQTK